MPHGKWEWIIVIACLIIAPLLGTLAFTEKSIYSAIAAILILLFAFLIPFANRKIRINQKEKLKEMTGK